SLANVSGISETKGETVIEKLTADFRSGGSKFRLNIFLLSLLMLATIAAVVFFTSRKQEISTTAKTIPVVIKDNPKTETNIPVIPKEIIENPLPRANPVIVAFLDSSNDGDSTPIQNLNTVSSSSIPSTLHIPEDFSLHYEDIPSLSDDQKKQTEKDKLKMMRDIAKKKTYGNLPPGKTYYNGSLQKVDGFSIENSEVTNLEYRTFLNDLLTQGKFDDYLLAKPVSGQWKNTGIPEFEDVYFENAAYNSFPAVNMTRKGAELYCEWLTNSMKDAITKKEVKWSGNKMPDFRLPTNLEWIYAARGCDTTALKFPWGRTIPDSVQNHNGCFLCDFNYTISKDRFEGKHICAGYQRLKQGGYHHTIITTAGLAIDTLITCPVYSYNPNTCGQYCMMGNVSEMVWTYDVSNPSAKGVARSMGGSWYSDVSNILIDAPEQYVGVTDAKPFIGFRPVMNGYYNYAMIKQVHL
ncbi:MAG TPA: SUMF1/EgtB/PvdO family nonheme iron enzyme, partial [Bacteroidia bacterium]|nr:SUMF1/EgtB/PvdO family nonheme iron enzyme [Bacteroidia bacterium]